MLSIGPGFHPNRLNLAGGTIGAAETRMTPKGHEALLIGHATLFDVKYFAQTALYEASVKSTAIAPVTILRKEAAAHESGVLSATDGNGVRAKTECRSRSRTRESSATSLTALMNSHEFSYSRPT